MDCYNYRLSSLQPREIIQHLDEKFSNQSTVFKLNVSFVFILRNNQTPELQYYYARCKSLVREIWRSFAREKDILWCKASKTPRSRTPKVNLFAYSLEPTKPDGEEGEDQDEIDQENGDSKHEITAQLIHRFLCHYQSSLCLNLHQRHFSYIKDMNTYSKSYCCSRCGTFPKHVGMLHRHERTFKAKVQYQFPGGTYRTPPTIFQLLEDEHFTIPRHLKYFLTELPSTSSVCLTP